MITLLKHTLFPPACSFCYQPVQSDDSICSDCWNALTFYSTEQCLGCGELLHSPTDWLCEFCRGFSELPFHQKVPSALVYDAVSKPLILRLKERDEPHLARVFAKFFVQRFWGEMDAILPIPVHPIRLLSRGYNQSALLALGIRHWHPECPPVLLNLLKRSRYTPKQKGNNREERYKNVHNSFFVPDQSRGWVAGKRLALLDDVIGSGATLQEAQRTLLEAGASEVRCMTLAKPL